MNRDLSWVDYQEDKTSLASQKIHSHMDSILKKSNLEPLEIKGLIYPAGPGSYTGMRVSKGIADMFSAQGIKVYTFYQFDVPKILGFETGCWITNAFKGEIFQYYWNKKSVEGEKRLTPIKDFSIEEGMRYFSSEEKFEFAESALTLVKENPQALFGEVLKREQHLETFYYRQLEDEFQKHV